MHTIRDIRDSRQCSQDCSRLGFVSALSQLRLDYALASISCDHCRSSRNHPHCVPRHIIYYYLLIIQILRSLKSFCGKRDALDYAGINLKFLLLLYTFFTKIIFVLVVSLCIKMIIIVSIIVISIL